MLSNCLGGLQFLFGIAANPPSNFLDEFEGRGSKSTGGLDRNRLENVGVAHAFVFLSLPVLAASAADPACKAAAVKSHSA